MIKGEEEWEVERILNKQKIRGKDKYLVQQKGFMAESDTWEGRENLGNAKEAIEKFEKEYKWDIEDVKKQEREEEMFRKGELPGRFMAKKLFGQMDKRYDQEYWRRLERNWNRWKGNQQKKGQPGKRKTILETIEEEEEIEQGNLGIREQTDEDDEIGNIADPYYEL